MGAAPPPRAVRPGTGGGANGTAGTLGVGGNGDVLRGGGGGGGGRYGGGGGGAPASSGEGAGGGGGSGLSTGVNQLLETGVRTGAGLAVVSW